MQHALFGTMGAIVRLVHPIMPYLSEEIWDLLPQTTGFVAVAPYPKPSDYPSDDAVLEDVRVLQEAVIEVRRIRGEMQIPKKVTLELRIADAALYGRLLAHAGGLNELAAVTVTRLVERPRGAATAVVQGIECAIPLEGVVDFSEEVDRLSKEITKIEKDVGDLDKRLSNKGFVDRAPEAVVADFREKLDTARVRLDTLHASRDRLLAAMGA